MVPGLDAEARQEAIAKATGKQFCATQQQGGSSDEDDEDDGSSCSSGGDNAAGGNVRRGRSNISHPVEGSRSQQVGSETAVASGASAAKVDDEGAGDGEEASAIAPALDVGGESTAGTEADRAEIAALLAEEKVRPVHRST